MQLSVCLPTYSMAPLCVLVLKSNRNGNSDNILFIDASKDFVKGKKQNELSEEHIQKIVDAYKDRKDIDKYAHVATMDEIRENGYNLNIPRYVDSSEKEAEIDLDAVTEEIQGINAEIAEAEKTLKESFDLLGLRFPF